MIRTRRNAFTLTEIMVSIAIVLALTAISASVFLRAKDASKIDVEISQMHQIGLAANLYHDQNDAWPMSTTELVEANLIPKAICLSPRDKYKVGWANAWMLEAGSEPIVADYAKEVSKFPNTYLCIGEMHRVRKYELAQYYGLDNFGLFVSMLDVKAPFGSITNPNIDVRFPTKGIYRRVLLDGSVVVRHLDYITGYDRKGHFIQLNQHYAWFFDPDKEWIDRELNSVYR